MAIWKTDFSLNEIREMCKATMLEHLDICIEEIGDDFVRATMPVDHRTQQIYGLLHRGASVALAESVGSLACHMTLEPGGRCVGLEINANHLRGKTQGTVTAIAKPVHTGRTTQVWDIRIIDEDQRLISVSRLTMAILNS
jgi:1,4-dihydroxy-2-naphthoyl-CoA hydrolase